LLSRSYSDLSTHDVAVNTDISGDVMGADQEYNIEGALADEVQMLQNAQQKLYHQMEEKENEIRKLKLEQLTSNLELKTLNEVRHSYLYNAPIYVCTYVCMHVCMYVCMYRIYSICGTYSNSSPVRYYSSTSNLILIINFNCSTPLNSTACTNF